jgi:hypothetical protein
MIIIDAFKQVDSYAYLNVYQFNLFNLNYFYKLKILHVDDSKTLQ